MASKFLSIFEYYEIDKKIENKDISFNLELILFLTFFHEIFGHTKGGYSQKKNDICKSPNVFYDKKEKKLLKLVNRNCIYLNDNEVPILRGDEEEDAGHFLEYFIGKCEYGYYSEIIEIMLLNNIKLNFILDVDMWNKKIETMRKYIKYKYIVYSYDKNLLDKEKFSDIDAEIKELESIKKEKNIDLNNIKKINEIKNLGKNEEKEIEAKKSELKEYNGIAKKEYEKYKNYSSEELQNIAFKKETPRELRDIIYDIIFSRIIKS